MNEAYVSRKLREALEDEGAVCWKLSDRFHAARPDLVSCFLGQFIAIETKIHPNKLTLLQERELASLALVDAWCYCVTYRPEFKLLVAVQHCSWDAASFSDYKECARWLLKLPSLNTNAKSLSL
jgi:hypothetical protein